MDEDEWMYESIMFEEADMDYQNEEACGANEPHVNCSDAFNTSQVIMLMFVIDLIKWILVENLNYVDCFVGVWQSRRCFPYNVGTVFNQLGCIW